MRLAAANGDPMVTLTEKTSALQKRPAADGPRGKLHKGAGPGTSDMALARQPAAHEQMPDFQMFAALVDPVMSTTPCCNGTCATPASPEAGLGRMVDQKKAVAIAVRKCIVTAAFVKIGRVAATTGLKQSRPSAEGLAGPASSSAGYCGTSFSNYRAERRIGSGSANQVTTVPGHSDSVIHGAIARRPVRVRSTSPSNSVEACIGR